MILPVVPLQDRESTASPLSDADVADLALAFKMLGDETRLRMVLYISRHGRAHVTELREWLGMQQPLVSHHLALLRSAGILVARREGRFQYYSLDSAALKRLMEVLAAQQGGATPCDRFLDCVFK